MLPLSHSIWKSCDKGFNYSEISYFYVGQLSISSTSISIQITCQRWTFQICFLKKEVKRFEEFNREGIGWCWSGPFIPKDDGFPCIPGFNFGTNLRRTSDWYFLKKGHGSICKLNVYSMGSEYFWTSYCWVLRASTTNRLSNMHQHVQSDQFFKVLAGTRMLVKVISICFLCINLCSFVF